MLKLSTLSLVMSRQLNSCFSAEAPVLPFSMKESASSTAFLEKTATGCRTVYCSSPDLIASTAAGEPSKPPTLMSLSLPASLSAEIAPSAISSLPLMTPMMSGCACSMPCILSWPCVRSQLATCEATFFRSGYWLSTVS